MRMMKPSKLRLSGAIALGLMILLSVGMFAGAADVALPDTVTYERMTALSDIDDVREDEVFERLTGLTLDDAQLALLMAQREITLMVPDEKALPEGFALREGGTSASFRLSHGTEQILLPSGFTPPVGAPDASYEQDGYLVETWDIPAAELTETYNNLVRHYLYGDHGLVTYNVMLRTLDEALPGFTERLGVLDNGLMVVGELGGGVETIYAVPEDAYAAYSNGEPGEVTEIYIMYSRTLTTSQMMPLLESAAAL